ncbi:MAG: hypothetical protein ABJG88_00535 [Litorimonas sp.]
MAAAQTDDGKRGEVFCFPTKSVPKIVNRINAVGVDRRDVVDVRLDPKFLIKDGGVWPDAFYLAKDGQPIMDMPFSREDGRVANFLEAVALEPNSDICVVDPTRADKSEDDEGLYFEMGLSPVFLKATGEHNIEDIKKGSRDAKSFYKKMIPAPLRLLMPDTNYLAVKYKDPKFLVDNARPEIFARVDGSDIELDYERHKDMFIVSGKNLRKMGASMLVVSGGEYDLQPVPSLSMIRRFEKQSKDDSKSVEVGIDATESVDDEHTPFEQ